MIQLNGFFEYGIAALLGAVGMIGLSIWALISDDVREYNKQAMKTNPETTAPSDLPHKKAA
jgi:hypothetical protein